MKPRAHEAEGSAGIGNRIHRSAATDLRSVLTGSASGILVIITLTGSASGILVIITLTGSASGTKRSTKSGCAGGRAEAQRARRHVTATEHNEQRKQAESSREECASKARTRALPAILRVCAHAGRRICACDLLGGHLLRRFFRSFFREKGFFHLHLLFLCFIHAAFDGKLLQWLAVAGSGWHRLAPAGTALAGTG